MQHYLNIALTAAKEAGQFIVKGSQNLNSLAIEEKSLNDFVSEIDRGAENIIRRIIQSEFPEHKILGEEFGVLETTKSAFQWIIDPLDGTTNFLRGVPHYAVSIALTLDSNPIVAVVFDPIKNELFSAVKGQGAVLNDRPMKCKPRNGIHGSLLATGIPFSGELLARVDEFNHAMVGLLQQETSGIRRLGAAALDLAYVAAGRYDGFWEASLKPWDIAAGVLLVTEAGGVVADFNGEANYLTNGNIVAASSGVFKEMYATVNAAYS